MFNYFLKFDLSRLLAAEVGDKFFLGPVWVRGHKDLELRSSLTLEDFLYGWQNGLQLWSKTSRNMIG